MTTMHRTWRGKGNCVDPTVERLAKNRRTYEAFVAAWRRHDLDALTALVTADVVYAASVGPEPGTTYIGRDAARRGFQIMLEYDAAEEVDGGRVTFVEDLAYAEWTYVVNTVTKERSCVRGIDVFEFVDGLVARKDAFRKTL